MDPGSLDQIISHLKIKTSPEVLVGIEEPDDAGIFKLSDDVCLVQTLDFLTPITAAPYDFGQIAAANSLSDVYAMGGTPLTAMNIVCFSFDCLDSSVLKETLSGGLDKIHESGAVLLGGHSVEDPEFKYGLSVTGTVSPSRYLKNAATRPGETLILTKPIGTGILATAIKAGIADATAEKILVETASTLNKKAAEIMLEFNPSACTDITGFGLAGHLLEMALAGKTKIVIDNSQVPVLANTLEFAQMGLIPAGAYKNREWCAHRVTIQPSVPRERADLFFDPQTSGGLLFSLPTKNSRTCLQKMRDSGIPAAAIAEIHQTEGSGEIAII